MVIAARDREILPFDDVLDARIHEVGMQELAHAECLFHVLVCIDGRNAAAGGAELLVGKAFLFDAVHEDVIGHGDDRPVANFEVFGADLDALLAKAAHLFGEMLDVDDHAGAEHVDDVLAQDARGQQIEDELSPLVDDGVARVVPALIAADDVVSFGKEVDHLPLSFVAPVDPANGCQHLFSSQSPHCT